MLRSCQNGIRPERDALPAAAETARLPTLGASRAHAGGCLFSAEYGQTGAAVVNMVTRSGTNDFHGTGYYFLRDEMLNANDWFSNRAGRALPAFHRAA